jgi:hypothetical protein
LSAPPLMLEAALWVMNLTIRLVSSSRAFDAIDNFGADENRILVVEWTLAMSWGSNFATF